MDRSLNPTVLPWPPSENCPVARRIVPTAVTTTIIGAAIAATAAATTAAVATVSTAVK